MQLPANHHDTHQLHLFADMSLQASGQTILDNCNYFISNICMQKRFNRQLRKLTLALALPLAAAALPGCDSFHQVTDAEYVAKAKAAQDAGDLKAGALELKNALLKNPDNIEARLMLGEINVTLGNGADAEKELRKAMELGLKREYVLLPLAKSLLLQQKNQQVIDEIDAPSILRTDERGELSPSLPGPGDTIKPSILRTDERAKLRAYRGAAWLGLDKPDQAKVEFEQALAIDGKSGVAKLGLASLALAGNELDKALQLTQEAVDAAPAEASAWSFLGELDKAKGKFEEAEASYGKAIELNPSNTTDRANRALVRIELKKFGEAREDIDILKKQAPQFFLTHHVEGVLLCVEGKYPEAETALAEASKLNERYPFTQYYLGMSQLQQNRLAEADSAIGRFLAALPGSVEGHRLMGLIKFREKDYAGAKAALLPIIQSNPNDFFSVKLMGSVELGLGNRRQGMEYLQKAAGLEPDSASTELQMGLSLLASGEKAKGMDALEKAAELDPDFTLAEVYLVSQHIEAKEFAQAEQMVAKLKQKMPGDALPWSLEGTIHMAQGDNERAKREFEDALVKSPGDPTAGNNLASLALAGNKRDDARKYYQQVLEKHPEHLPTLVNLAKLDALDDKPQDMVERLNAIIAKDSDALEPRLILARHFSRSGQARKALTVLEPMRTKHPGNVEVLAVLVEAELETRERSQAMQTAQALAKAAPNSALAQYYLSRTYAEGQDLKAMRPALERSLQLDPKFLPSRLVMVKLLMLERKPAEAERLLAALGKEHPDNPEVMGLRGWYALQQNRPEDAVNIYRGAFDKYPTTTFALDLAQTQWRLGKKQESLATLEEWNQQHPKDTMALRVRSAMYSSLGRFDDAKAQLRKVLETEPNDVIALNDLAWLLRNDNPAEAQEYAEKALSIAPKATQPMDTMGVILLNRNQGERAVNLLRQASRQSPQYPAIRYHLAMALEKNGNHGEAVAILQDLLAGRKEFRDRAEVQALLNRLSPP